MSIDASIPLGIRPLQVNSPLETLSQIMRLQNYGQQAETERLQQRRLRQDITAHDQAIEDDAAIRAELMKTKNAKGEPDIDTAVKNLYTNGHPQAAVKLDEHIQTARKRAADADKVNIENRAAKAKEISQHVNGVHDEPTFQAARKAVFDLIGPEAAAPMGDTYNPTVIDQIQTAGTEASVHWRKVQDAQDSIEKALAANQTREKDAPAALTAWTTAVGKTMETSRSQEDWDHHLQSLRLYGAPDAVLETYPAQFSPAAVKQAHTNAMTAGQAETSQHEDQRIRLESERLAFEKRKFDADPRSSDPAYQRDWQQYTEYVQVHNHEQATRMTPVDPTNPYLPQRREQYQAPPTFEQWRALNGRTPVQTPSTPKIPTASATPMTPADITATAPGVRPQAPAPTQLKAVTVAELTTLARSRGTTLEQERARAIAAGYAVVR